jgi:hypothetical protein
MKNVGARILITALDMILESSWKLQSLASENA